ncbi:DSBA-like thioredoxin domain-containing protein [Xylaria longipes]|nr:DSBA-like thioredoxin domain-containing protein [Xylaria longipes]
MTTRLVSYISSHRFQRLIEAHNVEVIYKPVDILHVFSQSGGLPVKQPSPQRQAYRLLEMERWHKAVWADEGDIADHGTITKLANEAGLDGSRLLKRANEEKGLIEQEAGLTKDILDRKYLPFGGSERLDMLEDVIKSDREPLSLPDNFNGS